MRNITSAVGWQRTGVTLEGFLEEVGLELSFKVKPVGSDLIQDTAMPEKRTLSILCQH